MERFLPRWHLFGTTIRLHPSWLPLVAVLISGSATVDPTLPASAPPTEHYLRGTVIALTLFAAACLHEGARLAVARWCHWRQPEQTLYFFGSLPPWTAAQLQPRRETFLALVGPLANSLCAAICGLIWWRVAPLPTAVALVLAIMAGVNACLALVCLLPGYPLSGGRLLRTLCWYLLDDLGKATLVTVIIGQLLAWVAIGAGAALFLRSQFFWALLLIVGGLIVQYAGRQSYRDQVWQQRSKATAVIHAAIINAPQIPPQQLLDDVVEALLDRTNPGQEAPPAIVVAASGEPVGLLGLPQIRAVSRREWATTTADAAMVPLRSLPMVPAELPLDQALAVCKAGRYSYALVIDATQPATAPGIITPNQIERYLAHLSL